MKYKTNELLYWILTFVVAGDVVGSDTFFSNRLNMDEGCLLRFSGLPTAKMKLKSWFFKADLTQEFVTVACWYTLYYNVKLLLRLEYIVIDWFRSFFTKSTYHKATKHWFYTKLSLPGTRVIFCFGFIFDSLLLISIGFDGTFILKIVAVGFGLLVVISFCCICFIFSSSCSFFFVSLSSASKRSESFLRPFGLEAVAELFWGTFICKFGVKLDRLVSFREAKK